jgi:hypothetical protein
MAEREEQHGRRRQHVQPRRPDQRQAAALQAPRPAGGAPRLDVGTDRVAPDARGREGEAVAQRASLRGAG